MAYTFVGTLDAALDALNGARFALWSDFCSIQLGENEVRVWLHGYGTREINSATTVVDLAMRTVNAAVQAEARIRLVEDHKGHWVAIRAQNLRHPARARAALS